MNTSTNSAPHAQPFRLIDAHAHLSTPELQPELETLLERARAQGIEAIVNICTNPEELQTGLKLAQKHPWIYNVASTTPHDAATEGEAHFATFEAHARAGDLVAVGETGLDYFYYKDTAEIQQEMTRRYLRLAKECDLSVVIHCRDAFEDLFRVLDGEEKVPGVLHCFTGTLEEAKEVVARDWYLSLSGIVTYKKSVDLREVAKMVPLERLLIETDTPYLAPHPYRSKRNEPAFLVETAKCIAEVRGISVEELASATSQNARDLFQI